MTQGIRTGAAHFYRRWIDAARWENLGGEQ